MQPVFRSPHPDLLSRVEPWLLSPRTPWILIALGVFLRLARYLHNPTLWMDEAALVFNIVNRNARELLEPLAFKQQAPVGFLWIEKLASDWLGTSEYAFRLWPLLCGVFSLIVLHRVVRRLLPPLEANLALLLFAISDYLVYYSSEVKPYSGDVLFALLIMAAAIQFIETPSSRKAAFAFATIGFLGPWFSYASVLVLAGVGSVALWEFWRRRDWKSLGRTVSLVLVWVAAFLANYFLFWFHRAASPSFVGSFSLRFPPFPPRSLGQAFQYLEQYFAFLEYPGGFELTGIAALLFLLGALHLARRQPVTCYLLMAPLLVTFTVALFRKYPFEGRLILFLVPASLILIATGLAWIWVRTRPVAPVLGALVTALLLLHPVALAFHHLSRPRTTQQIRPMIDTLNTSTQDGDVLYVYRYALPAFAYYRETRRELKIRSFVVGDAVPLINSSRRLHHYADVLRLKGSPRVWVFLAYFTDDEYWRIVGVLDSIGTRVQAVEGHRASLFLYDLSSSPGK